MANDFTLRAATPGDEAAITALLTAAYGALMRPAYEEKVLSAALPAMGRANPALLDSGSYYVAETAEGRLVSCGGWSVEAPGSGKIEAGLAHIRHFGTHPDWARRGTGRAIFNRCMEEAKAAGVRKFECCASLNAEPFYKSFGFETVEPIEIPVAPGIRMPCLLMRREI